ncbi:response regulator [Inediibacterium massiliense]|uniref:response regulator n=1 Tax=Inediibacterium massiliense TaxID=1658111 RepID=UPI0006B50103|nr:response regulator [Inediibacterium massiliense]
MKNTFLIIDDDINIRKMLKYLIIKNDLGNVLEELDRGEDAPEEIVFYQPDIVLIDFLLPQKDGIEIIQTSKALGYRGKFIMISQVEDAHMISKAYENGILFFIHKPLNQIEALNVIQGVCHNIELERSVALIKDAVFHIEKSKPIEPQFNWKKQIDDIFTDIGIIGELGYNDLIELISQVISYNKKNISGSYQLQDIYRKIAEKKNMMYNSSVYARTIEQRIRRTILKALENIATLGHDDYYNNKFIEYSSSLFDFKQVKQEIRHIQNSKEDRGKISVKKFIEGIVSRLNI